MANTRSARKNVRQNLRRRARNRANRSRLRTQVQRFLHRLGSGTEPEQVRAELSRTLSLVDKAARKGILHRNTAARKKSYLTRKANRTLASAG